MINAFLIDAVRALHFLFILFLLGGLLAIPGGIALRAVWVTSPFFRWPHIAASLFLVLRIATHSPCPLTQLEYALRGTDRTPRSSDTLLLRHADAHQLTAGILAQAALTTLFFLIRPPRAKPTPALRTFLITQS